MEQKNGDLIKHLLLQKHGLTLKAFAAMNGFSYHMVSNVVRGTNKGRYGKGRCVADKLNEFLRGVAV